ncbi:hypothetical protein C4585_01910 [Candidatus Parcubacteria bacterium]|nr:MAG: hypothetical protein C4585_01910 [Candidatus Parcubacteria bacterium]
MTLEKTLRWIVLGGIFMLPFIPFIVANSLFFPFITGKNFTFRIVVEVITAAWLALALVHPAYRPRREWLFGAFAVFVLIIAAADLFGAYPFKSFWSNFERMDGWVTLAHLFAYFVVASTTLSCEKLWRRLFQVSLSASVLVGGHALLQLFGVASLNPGFSSTARLDASFGNPIYLAAYMLFHVFIAALLIADLYKDKSRNTYGWTLAYGSVLAFDMLILFLTGTRGAMLGLTGGILLAVFLFALRSGAEPKIRKIAIAIIALIVLFAGSIYVVRDQEWVRNAPILGRLATISISEQTAQARMMNWGIAWQGVKERPLLGWGQENFAIVFNKYYNPNMYTQEQWFDRVHNIIFDWLIAGGFLGLFAYLALFIISLWYIWRRIEVFSPIEQSILTGLLAAYFFHNLFVFDNIVSYILFVTILAFIAFRANEAGQATPLLPKLSFPSGALPIVAVATVIGLWGAAWYVNADALATNKALIRAISPQQEGLQKNFEYFEEALSRKSLGLQETREQLIQVTGQQLARNENVPLDIKQKFLQRAADEMSQQAKDSPLDPRFPLFLGSLLNIYGFYNEAAPVLAKASELAPKKQTILYEMGTNAFARGDINAGVAAFKEAHEAAPEFTEPRILYAAALIQAKKFTEADTVLAPIVESGVAADPRIAAAYIAAGRKIDRIVPIWEARVRVMPNDVEARFLLAGAYGELRNITKAREHLDAAVAIDPSVKARAEQLMNEIRGVR